MLFNADHLCDIEIRKHKHILTYSGGTGTPTAGQTVTGATSHSTAVISRVESGALVIKDLSAAFTVGETISTLTLSGGTLSAQEIYERSDGEFEYYWESCATGVRCRFYRTSARILIITPGQTVARPLKCAMRTVCGMTAQSAADYRIITTETQFAGTYLIDEFTPVQGMSINVQHYELKLMAVPT